MADSKATKPRGAKRSRAKKEDAEVDRQHMVFGDSDDEDGVETKVIQGAKVGSKIKISKGGEGSKREPRFKVKEDGTKESRRERRKRRRMEKGIPERESEADGKSKLEKKLKCFGGKVFGITVRSKAEDGEDDDADEEETKADAELPSFDEIKANIEKAGGKVSGILHKKVFALIASDRAVRRRSQKVRKAVKYNVPVVKVAFLDACIAAKSLVAKEPFLHEVPEEDSVVRKAPAFAIVENAEEDSESLTPKPVIEIDLGCCCSCHDAGKASCEWCEAHH